MAHILNILSNLDYVEILKTGAIGLGFLLVVFSFILLRREQKKAKPSLTMLGAIFVFMAFSLVILAVGAFTDLSKAGSNISLSLGNNKLVVNEWAHQNSAQIDLKTYYVDTEKGFAFQKPPDNWSDIDVFKGINQMLEKQELVSENLSTETIDAALMNSPLRGFFNESSNYYFNNPSSSFTVQATDSTINQLIDLNLKHYSILLTDTTQNGIDTSIIENRLLYEEQLSQIQKQLLGFQSMTLSEGFVIQAFPKKELPQQLQNLSLPGFFNIVFTVLGANADKLAAKDDQILAGSVLRLEHVDIDGRPGTLENKKWMLFTENEKYFFIIEINYPQTTLSRPDNWDQLQSCMNSFTLLN